VDDLLELLQGRADVVELDRAALELASLEHPGLKPEPYLELLDSHAAELAVRLRGGAGGRLFLQTLNEYLFSELGFAGNTANYYDPANSCLNDVLTARLGIPITLSLVHMEIARRLGKSVRGIGLPGHFVVRYDDGLFSAYVDPFHAGRLLTAEQCFELSSQSAGRAAARDPQLLAPVTKRQILVRMLFNLRGVYRMRGSHGKRLQVLKLLIAAHPGESGELQKEARDLKRQLARLN